MLSCKLLTLFIIIQNASSLELFSIIGDGGLQGTKNGKIEPDTAGHVGVWGCSFSDTLRDMKNKARKDGDTSYYQIQPHQTFKGKTGTKEDCRDIPSQEFKSVQGLTSYHQRAHHTDKSLRISPDTVPNPSSILQRPKDDSLSSGPNNSRTSARDHTEVVTGQLNQLISQNARLEHGPIVKNDSKDVIMDREIRFSKTPLETKAEREGGNLSIMVKVEPQLEDKREIQGSSMAPIVKEDRFATLARTKFGNKDREVLNEAMNERTATENRPVLKSKLNQAANSTRRTLLVTPINPRMLSKSSSKAKEPVVTGPDDKTRQETTMFAPTYTTGKSFDQKNEVIEKNHLSLEKTLGRSKSSLKVNSEEQDGHEKSYQIQLNTVNLSNTALSNAMRPPKKMSRQNKSDRTGFINKYEGTKKFPLPQGSRAENRAPTQDSLRGTGNHDNSVWNKTDRPRSVGIHKPLNSVEESNPKVAHSESSNSSTDGPSREDLLQVNARTYEGKNDDDLGRRFNKKQQAPDKDAQTPTGTRLNLITENPAGKNSHEAQNHLDSKSEVDKRSDLEDVASPRGLQQENSENKDSSDNISPNPQSEEVDQMLDPRKDLSIKGKGKAQAKKNKKRQSKKNKKAISKGEDQFLKDLEAIRTHGQDQNNKRLTEIEFNQMKKLSDEKIEPDSVDTLVNQVMSLNDNRKNLNIILTESDFIDISRRMDQGQEMWNPARQRLWDKFSKVTEARLRFISFSEQYNQKLIFQRWKILKGFLSPSAIKFAQMLKVEEEFPVFAESTIEEWMELPTYIGPVLADRYQHSLVRDIFCGRYADRIATFYMMLHLDQRYTELLKPKMGELMRRGAKGSLLLLISSILEYPSGMESWGSWGHDKLVQKTAMLAETLIGKYCPIDNKSMKLELFDHGFENWTREYTRDVLLYTDNSVLPSFEDRLKKFINCGDRKGIPYNNMEIGLGEIIAGLHIGLDVQELLALFQMLNAGGAQWFDKSKICTVKNWPQNLRSELVGKEDLIKQFFEFRNEKVLGLADQIEKWKHMKNN